jgi:DNA polymerase-3 subunit alpha
VNAPRFVHLRLHSEYSVTDGIVRIEEAVAKAAAYSMPCLALTDSANVFGMVKFYKAARAAGIKPIVGADCWIRNDADREKPARLLLLCASAAGYRKLFRAAVARVAEEPVPRARRDRQELVRGRRGPTD